MVRAVGDSCREEGGGKRVTPRQEILQAVNRFTLGFHRKNENACRRPLPPARMYGSRHIQEAVCIARRRGLVSNEVLIAAGFNPRADA